MLILLDHDPLGMGLQGRLQDRLPDHLAETDRTESEVAVIRFFFFVRIDTDQLVHIPDFALLDIILEVDHRDAAAVFFDKAGSVAGRDIAPAGVELCLQIICGKRLKHLVIAVLTAGERSAGEDIYEGETYYQIGSKIFCEACIEDARTEAEYDN